MNTEKTISIELAVAYENDDSDFYYEPIPLTTANDGKKLLRFANEWIAKNTDISNHEIKGKTLLTIVTYPEDELAEPEILLQGYFTISEDSVSALQE